MIATGTTTLDSGIDVTGVYAISKDGFASGDTDTNTVTVNENSLSFGGAFGTISVGNVFSAGTMVHNRGTTLIPTASRQIIMHLDIIQKVEVLPVNIVHLMKLVTH